MIKQGAQSARRYVIVGSRFAASGLQLLLTVLVTQTAELSVAGSCLVMISWAQVLSGVASWGHAVVVMRNAAQAQSLGARYLLRGHLTRVLTTGALVAVGFCLVPFGVFSLFDAIAVGVAAGAQAVLRVVASHLKVLGREPVALLWEFSMVPLVLIGLVGGMSALGGELATEVFSATLAAATVAACAGAAATRASVMRASIAASVHPVDRSGQGALGTVSMLAILTAHAPVVIAPLLLSSTAVAPFVTAFRIASIATTITTALRGYYAPRLAAAIASRSAEVLHSLLSSSRRMGAVLASPLVVIVPIAAPLFDYVFGAGYGAVWPVYAVLAASQWINAATGVVGDVVGFGGGERALVQARITQLLVLVVGWGIQYLLDIESVLLFSAIYGFFLIVVNLTSLWLDLRTIRAIENDKLNSEERL